jgi:hypothetical protein
VRLHSVTLALTDSSTPLPDPGANRSQTSPEPLHADPVTDNLAYPHLSHPLGDRVGVASTTTTTTSMTHNNNTHTTPTSSPASRVVLRLTCEDFSLSHFHQGFDSMSSARVGRVRVEDGDALPAPDPAPRLGLGAASPLAPPADGFLGDNDSCLFLAQGLLGELRWRSVHCPRLALQPRPVHLALALSVARAGVLLDPARVAPLCLAVLAHLHPLLTSLSADPTDPTTAQLDPAAPLASGGRRRRESAGDKADRQQGGVGELVQAVEAERLAQVSAWISLFYRIGLSKLYGGGGAIT